MEILKQIVRDNCKDDNFNNAFQFTKERVIRRLVKADKKYWRTDGALGADNTDNYFYHQATIVIQSYQWSNLVTKNYEKMNKIIQNKCWPDEQDDVFGYVFEKIIDNDYRLLRTNRKIPPDKYFFTQVRNKIKEYFSKKCKPPKWIRKHENFLFWTVYRLLCCRHLDKYEVINILIQNGRKETAVENVVSEIQTELPECGLTDKTIKEGEYEPPDPVTIFLKKLLDIISNGTYEENPEDTTIIKDIKKKLIKINIKPRQRIMLRLYYCEEYTYKEIAEKMGMRIYQVSGKIAYIIKQLSKILKPYFEKNISQFEAIF